MSFKYKIDPGSEGQIRRVNDNFYEFLSNRSDSFTELMYANYIKDDTFYRRSAINCIIHTINLMKYKIGAEVGVSHGHSTITLLDNCPSLSKLYAIDFYQPYTDYYTADFYVDEYEVNIIKNIAHRLINSSDNKDKVKFYEEDSDISVERFADGELDFVFLDAHLNSEHIKKDLEKWYPKVRKGGLIAIHDTNYVTVLNEIQEFMERVNFEGRYSDYDKTSCLLKL